MPTVRDYDPAMTDKRSDMPHQRTPDHKPTDQPASNKEPSDFNDPVDEASDESFPASDPPAY